MSMADYESVGVMFKWIVVFLICLFGFCWLMAGGFSHHLVTCYDKTDKVIGNYHYYSVTKSPDDGNCAVIAMNDDQIHSCARCEER